MSESSPVVKPGPSQKVFTAIDESTGQPAQFFLAEAAKALGEHSWLNATWIRVDRARWKQDPCYWTGTSLSPESTPERPQRLKPDPLWIIGADPMWRGPRPAAGS